MAQLRIQLLGGLEVRRGARVLPAFATHRSKSLFAYLVLHRDRRVHRETLCCEFWGERTEAAARKALRTALWRIRSVLEPQESERGSCLVVDGPEVGFRGAGVWVDAWEFEEAARPAEAGGQDLGRADVERLVHAASLYRGDLLEGHYDAWSLAEQDRLRLTYLAVLERLVAHRVAGGQWSEAISFGQRILRRDPVREHIHRTLMQCHLALGDRPSALRQYAHCVRALRRELEVSPMEETLDLFRSIRGRERSIAGPDPGADERADTTLAALDEALHALADVTQRLEVARDALQKAAARVPDERRRRRANA